MAYQRWSGEPKTAAGRKREQKFGATLATSPTATKASKTGYPHIPEFPATSTSRGVAPSGPRPKPTTPLKTVQAAGAYAKVNPNYTDAEKARAQKGSAHYSAAPEAARVSKPGRARQSWKGARQSGWNDTVFGSPRAHFDAGHAAGTY